MNNISTEASFLNSLNLHNSSSIGQPALSFHNCKAHTISAAVLSVQFSDQVINKLSKLLASHEVVDKFLQQWQRGLFFQNTLFS